MQAITLKLKAGPASPGLPGSDSGTGGGESAAGGQHRGGGAPSIHGSVKWAPLSSTRRIGSGGEGAAHTLLVSIAPFIVVTGHMCATTQSCLDVLSLLAFSGPGVAT